MVQVGVIGRGLIFWGVWVFSGVHSKRASSTSVLSDILDDLDLHSDSRVRPQYGEKPLEVQAFAFIRDIIEINEEKSSMTVNLLLMQIWHDPRLSFAGAEDAGSVTEILVDDPQFMFTFWNPDTFVVNEVNGGCSSSGGKNLANQIIRLSRNGDVLKTSRLTVTVACPMHFETYPMHVFTCDIEMESFGHKTDDILYIWRNGSKSIDMSKVDTQTLAGKTSYSLLSVETHSQQSYLDTGGSYSKLIIRFSLRKLWLRHAITFFIPTGLLTVCSLLSLWVCGWRHAATGVVANFIIAGLLVLLMALEYSTSVLLSRVSFLTPVDFHLGICLSTVFSSIAFHSVTYCCRNSRCHEDERRRAARATRKKVKPGLVKHTNLKDEVTYYESYDDVAAADNDDDYDDQRGGDNVTVEGARKEDVELKTRSRKMKFVACLCSFSLTLSKYLSLVCFLATEGLLWYTYVIGWSNGATSSPLST